MNYLLPSRRPAQARARAALFAAGVAAAIVVGLIFLVPHFFPALWTSIARPFWRTEFSVASGSLDTPAALLSENESLKRQLASDAVAMQSVQALQQDNADLEALMGRASTSPYILGAVLERPPVAPYDELIIDIGQDHKLSTTSLVYAPGNVPIGRVSDVLSQTSKAILFSSPGQKYDVLIGAAHVPATAVGLGGGQYEADLPQGAKISEGDAVMDMSVSDAPFGIVASVKSDPANPFETVLFAPPVDIYQLRWVLIKP